MKEGIQFTHICKIPLGGINTQQETSHSLCTCLGQKHYNTGFTPGLLNTSFFWPGYRYSSPKLLVEPPWRASKSHTVSWSHGNDESSVCPRIWWDQAKVLQRTITQVLDRPGTISLFKCVIYDNAPELLMLFWSPSEIKYFSSVIIHPISSTLLMSDNYKCQDPHPTCPGHPEVIPVSIRVAAAQCLCSWASWQCWWGLAANQSQPWSGKKHWTWDLSMGFVHEGGSSP